MIDRQSYEASHSPDAWWTDVLWDDDAWMDEAWLVTATEFAAQDDRHQRLQEDLTEATTVGAEAATARLRAAVLRGEIISATRAGSRRRASVPRTRVADASELSATAQQFGADTLQVRRDHLISHLLAALSTNLGSAADNLVLIGGTALSAQFCPACA